ncbi:MAG TPA: recombinase family protein [Longimicrobium sp.]|nr:recombinase family protein [Longimicrobium sp.]
MPGKKTAGKRVGIWIRVSKLAHRARAGDKSESPEHHRTRAVRYAEEQGWQVVEFYDLSDVSGKDVWRHPEAQRMVADVRRGHITGLIFSKLARLGRKTEALIRFQQIFSEYGADLIALDQPIDTTTADGRNYFRHKASDAEWEREQNSERMREDIEERARLGKQISGSSPFGYRWEKGVLVPDPTEVPIRRLIYELFAEHKRKGTVARLINKMGHRTRRGRPFTALAIERLILDPTAKGMHRRNYSTRAPDNRATLLKPESEWSWVAVEPIVSAELWEVCNAILTTNRKPQRRPAKRAVQLFAGLVFCGRCGEKMYVPSNTPKYVCQKCRMKIHKDELELVFREQLRSFFLSPAEIATHLEQSDERLQNQVALLEQLTREQQKLAAEMEKTYRLYLEDGVSVEGFRRLYRPLEERAKELQDELPRLQAEVDFVRLQNLSGESIASSGLSLFEHWENLALDERRTVIEAITQRISINGDEIDIELCYLPPPVEDVANCSRSPPARTTSYDAAAISARGTGITSTSVKADFGGLHQREGSELHPAKRDARAGFPCGMRRVPGTLPRTLPGSAPRVARTTMPQARDRRGEAAGYTSGEGSEMNPAHLHLLVNHVPVFGTIGAALLLAWGLLRKSEEVVRIGLVALIVIAAATWGVQLTGEPAEHMVENLAGMDERLIHDHEEAAELSTYVISAAGIAALLTFFLIRGRRKAGRAMTVVTLLLALAGFGMVAYAANLGGLIRHTEIHDSPLAPPVPAGEH